MKLKNILFTLSLLFIFLPAAVTAAPIPTPTPTPSVPDLPLMTGNQSVTLYQPVNRDVFAAGKTVSIDTVITGSVYVAGGNLNILGTINGNLIVAGGTVNISGNVNGNVIVAGGNVIVGPQALIKGYVLAAANQLTINGHLNGPIRLFSKNLFVNDSAFIGGSLEADVGQSSISDKAQIIGLKKITIIQNNNNSKAADSSFPTIFSLFSLVGQLLILLVFIRLISPAITSFLNPLSENWLSTLGWGLAILFITPLFVLFLFLTVIGIPMAFILIFLYFLNFYLSSIAFAVFVGNWLHNRHYLNTDNIYLQSIVALILFRVIEFIPVLGGITSFLIFLFGLGLLVQFQRSLFRH